MPEQRTTTRDVRRANQAAVLKHLYEGGPASRIALSNDTGLSRATVGNVISELLKSGVAIETGQVASDGGRPAILVEVNPAHTYVIGVDIGETGATIELFDLALHKMAAVQKQVELAPENVETLVTVIAEVVKDVTSALPVELDELLGIGVGVPGIIVRDGREYVHAPSLGWDHMPLQEMLREALPSRVLVDNGAKTMALAEAWYGAGRGASNVVVALIGTGVGAAILTDGRVFRGATSSAGEWGHTTVALNGRSCRCGARGCLEAYVGARGILGAYQPAQDAPSDTAIDERLALEQLRVRLIAGEEAALRTVRETGRYLGVGMANLINLLNPDKIVLGGWAGLLLGEHLLPIAIDEARRHALRPPFDRVSIELCHLGPDAVALGAAILVVEPFLEAGGLPQRESIRKVPNRLSRPGL
ncbi:MAG: ROK family protein [Acidimicrobiia bacterium]|nr:ROK family protein [Acidimicrobiia bacterium]